jgi:hypothetical protein
MDIIGKDFPLLGNASLLFEETELRPIISVLFLPSWSRANDSLNRLSPYVGGESICCQTSIVNLCTMEDEAWQSSETFQPKKYFVITK